MGIGTSLPLHKVNLFLGASWNDYSCSFAWKGAPHEHLPHPMCPQAPAVRECGWPGGALDKTLPAGLGSILRTTDLYPARGLWPADREGLSSGPFPGFQGHFLALPRTPVRTLE